MTPFSKYAAALVALILSALPLTAQDLNRFDGRTITFMVGSDTGGGYDTIARLVAKHMETTLPGSTIVVANEPRSSGLVALNRLYADDRDTPTVMMFNTGLLLQQVSGEERLRADFSKFDYVGKVTSEARYLVASTVSGITSWEDLVAYDGALLMPASSISSSGHVQAQMLAHVFELDLSPVTGFSGSEGRAALLKGEMQLDIASENSVRKLAKNNGAVPFLRFGPGSNVDFQALPEAASVAGNDAQSAVVDTIVGMTMLGRVILANPSMNADDLAAIRAGFDAAMESAAFLAEAEEMEIAVDPLGGEGTKALVLQVLGDGDTIGDILKAATN